MAVGFALWIDVGDGIAWARGTHEYRPLGSAAIASTDQFRPRDFHASKKPPGFLHHSFAGFFGSLEEVNVYLRKPVRRLRATPAHLTIK